MLTLSFKHHKKKRFLLQPIFRKNYNICIYESLTLPIFFTSYQKEGTFKF